MRVDRTFYRSAYRFGRPRWDTGQPRPELAELVRSCRPGRALDIGCGTGANAVFLAGSGWEVVAVDFAPEAIEAARRRAGVAQAHVPPAAGRGSGELRSPTFLVGDATRLRHDGVTGPFDLVLDIGCYHAIPERGRHAYATEVAAVTAPGADFYIAGISKAPASWRLLGARGTSADEVNGRFGSAFEVVEHWSPEPLGHNHEFILYHLVRQ